jgi:hypothetical protein
LGLTDHRKYVNNPVDSGACYLPACFLLLIISCQPLHHQFDNGWGIDGDSNLHSGLAAPGCDLGIPANPLSIQYTVMNLISFWSQSYTVFDRERLNGPFFGVIKHCKPSCDPNSLDPHHTFCVSQQRWIYCSNYCRWIVKINSCNHSNVNSSH